VRDDGNRRRLAWEHRTEWPLTLHALAWREFRDRLATHHLVGADRRTAHVDPVGDAASEHVLIGREHEGEGG
jgi:hypothetical protein